MVWAFNSSGVNCIYFQRLLNGVKLISNLADDICCQINISCTIEKEWQLKCFNTLKVKST